MKMIALLSALAGSASVVFAQGTLPAYPLESEIRFEVWNGTSWGNTVNASPGQQVEYRVVMNYTGPRTDLLGLGNSRYQVTFSNADNAGPSRDTPVAFPGDGTSTYTQNMLTAAEGASGGALSRYGRVTFGGIGQTAAIINRLRVFSHGGDVALNGAPDGSWLRISGEGSTQWPADALPGVQQSAATNLINRGIAAAQSGSGGPGSLNTFFVGGVQNLVVFRHAIRLSDLDAQRVMTITTFQGMLNRFGNTEDDRRYISWHDSTALGFGAYRTAVAIVPATIVIPTPGVFVLLSVGGVFAVGRRR